MPKYIFVLVLSAAILSPRASAQAPAAPTKPTEHLIGTVVAADPVAHTITVKEDKSGAQQVILLADTKTLIKVPPGAKDLKTFTRITAADLLTGDRVDIRGSKALEDPSRIAARSVVLMSGQDLQAAHQAQAAEWQSAAAGVVVSVDAGAQNLTIRLRTPEGPRSLTVTTSPQTEFTRYSPASPGTPVASRIDDIQPGDQVRIIAEGSVGASSLAAKRIYSGAFRTLNGSIVSVDESAKQLAIKDLATKKTVTVALADSSTVQRIPPELAARIARRLNPGAQGGGPAAPTHSAAPNDSPTPATTTSGAPPEPSRGGAPPTHGSRGGDISQLIERLPKISLADLKAGDVVVVSGVLSGADGGKLIATHIISGVEPILQSAPARQRGGQALGGDWGLGEMNVPQ